MTISSSFTRFLRPKGRNLANGHLFVSFRRYIYIIYIYYIYNYIYIYPERQMPSLTWYWCDAKFYLVELRMSGKLIWGCQICPPEPIWAQETPHGWREPLPTALPLAHAGNRGSPFFPLVASSFLWGLKRYRDDESGTLPPLLARVSTGMGQSMVINNSS